MEFQAVVLADHDDGSGTRLYPLLESTPKSLLPVAGRPLISYQLALLERSGFKEAIVVTTEKAREELHSFNEARASKALHAEHKTLQRAQSGKAEKLDELQRLIGGNGDEALRLFKLKAKRSKRLLTVMIPLVIIVPFWHSVSKPVTMNWLLSLIHI